MSKTDAEAGKEAGSRYGSLKKKITGGSGLTDKKPWIKWSAETPLHLQQQQLGSGHIITSVGTRWSISEY